jgi:hypothetical protein
LYRIFLARLTPVTLVTQEAEIERTMVEDQPRQKVPETSFQLIKS